MRLALDTTFAGRNRTGVGRVLRTSLLAGMVGVHAFQGPRWTVAGQVPGLAGSHHPSIAPSGLFATRSPPTPPATVPARP